MQFLFEEMDESVPRQTEPQRPAEMEYRPPELVDLGMAAELMQRDGTGHLIDGTGGWWVWGS